MKKIYLVLLLVLILHLFFLINIKFTAWPEMISFPYLINHGFVLYKYTIHAYPPLLVSTLAVLFNIFGYKLIVLKIFAWVSILVSDILVFLIVKRVTTNDKKALLGLLFFVFLQPFLEGNMVWPDLAIVPFLLLSVLSLFKKKYFLVGMSLALAFLIKQTGIFYFIFIFLYIILSTRNLKKTLIFLTPITLTLIFLVIVLISQNSFNAFLNWVIIYPSVYWTKFPGYVQMVPSQKEVFTLFLLFLPIIFFLRKRKLFKDKNLIILVGFLFCSVLSVYPRFSFFHFQSALAFLVIIYFYFANKIKIQILLITIPLIIFSLNSKNFTKGNRFWSSSDIKLANTIKAKTIDSSEVYLLGLQSGLYTFADKLPPKPWLDNFGWYFEIPNVQENTILKWSKNPPKYIVWQVPLSGNLYDLGVYQPQKITNWIKTNYNNKGEIAPAINLWQKK